MIPDIPLNLLLLSPVVRDFSSPPHRLCTVVVVANFASVARFARARGPWSPPQSPFLRVKRGQPEPPWVHQSSPSGNSGLSRPISALKGFSQITLIKRTKKQSTPEHHEKPANIYPFFEQSPNFPGKTDTRSLSRHKTKPCSSVI